MANQVQGKVFHDPVHGQIELHPLLVKIINTPQFQRLRNIKQLGGACFVYPGATHTRFEHSIGVAYLAGELVKALQSRQPELNITDIDVLCVQIAGLCHDLGHGPFSHLFDEMFMSKVPRDPRVPPNGANWTHEDASVAMFDHMVKENNLKRMMTYYELKKNDQTFVKELIKPPNNNGDNEQWNYQGRPEEKSFLYEIVANHQNEIDVDKFDYLARDCYHMGLQNNFNCRRFILYARVCDVGGRRRICSRDKDVANLYDMFHSRYCIHRKACQHRVTQSVQLMIADALLAADQHIYFTGSNGNIFTISTAKEDMEAYTQLTDEVLKQIQQSPGLREAQRIVKNIHERKLYKLVGEAKSTQPRQRIQPAKVQSLKDALVSVIPRKEIEVLEFKFDYGMNDMDPIKQTYFYRKRNPDIGYKIPQEQESSLVPAHFCKWIIRVFWKNTRNTDRTRRMMEETKRCFSNWCRDNGFVLNLATGEA